jgi:hypothetical protein
MMCRRIGREAEGARFAAMLLDRAAGFDPCVARGAAVVGPDAEAWARPLA